MEACLFCSCSFTKTSEVLPQVGGNISWRKQSKEHRPGKFGFSPSVSCCLSNSSSQDEVGPFISSDWRTFRAKLVARERVYQEDEFSSAAAGPDKAPAQSEGPITLTDKWAHVIHEPEKGCLLIATEKLDGVHIFERTVILLLSTGPVGPKGLILNRPSLMSIREMRSTAMEFSGRPLFFGGPLEDGLFLVGPTAESGGGYGVGNSGVFEEVMEGLYCGTKESVGCAAEMVKRGAVSAGDFRFYDGYCAWDRDQLLDEIRAGYWTVAACSPTLVGLSSSEGVGLWEEILGLVGPKKVW